MFKKRKSCRQFENKSIKEEELELILEAGQYAPSGGNSKSAKFVVLKDEKILNKLDQLVQEAFAKMEYREDLYISLKNSIHLSKQGKYHFSYQAPTLILFYNKKSYGNSMADCACALENMTLMATQLKIGSCYINQVHWLTENETIREFLANYNLEEDEDVYCALALGYPQSKEFFERERTIKKNQVFIY